MILANDLGPVGHAWLDAGLIDDSCSGLRCRMVVGEHGGIVCDMVAGTPGRRIASDRLAEVAASVATHAVVNTDPRSTDPLPLTDDTGAPVRIVTDENDARDRAVPTRKVIAASDESIVCGGPEPRSHVKSYRRRAYAHAGLSLASIAGAAALYGREDPSMGIMLFIAGFLAAGTAKWLRKAKAEASEHPERVTRHSSSMRELERRARLPDAITGTEAA